MCIEIIRNYSLVGGCARAEARTSATECVTIDCNSRTTGVSERLPCWWRSRELETQTTRPARRAESEASGRPLTTCQRTAFGHCETAPRPWRPYLASPPTEAPAGRHDHPHHRYLFIYLFDYLLIYLINHTHTYIHTYCLVTYLFVYFLNSNKMTLQRHYSQQDSQAPQRSTNSCPRNKVSP